MSEYFECPYCRKPVEVEADGSCPNCDNIVPYNAPRIVPLTGTPLGPFAKRLYVVQFIVIANAIIYFMMCLTGVHPMRPDTVEMVQWGSNFGPLTVGLGQWWRLFTCMFLHFGLIHVGLNMWVFWDIGQITERIMGNIGFAILYLVTGLASSLTSLAFHPLGVSAGASGAVFGVAGGLMGIIAFRKDVLPYENQQRLKRSMVNFVMINVFIGFAVPFINLAAHMGGFVAGFLCGGLMSNKVVTTKIENRNLRNALMAGVGTVGLGIFGVVVYKMLV